MRLFRGPSTLSLLILVLIPHFIECYRYNSFLTVSASNAFTHKYCLICVIDCYRCLPISQLAASSLSCAAAYRPILDCNIVCSRKYKHTRLIMRLRNLRYPFLIIGMMHPLCDLIYSTSQSYCVKFRLSLITLIDYSQLSILY